MFTLLLLPARFIFLPLKFEKYKMVLSLMLVVLAFGHLTTAEISTFWCTSFGDEYNLVGSCEAFADCKSGCQAFTCKGETKYACREVLDGLPNNDEQHICGYWSYGSKKTCSGFGGCSRGCKQTSCKGKTVFKCAGFNSDSGSTSDLAPGAVAAIAIVAFLLFIVAPIGVLICCCCCAGCALYRGNRSKQQSSGTVISTQPQVIDYSRPQVPRVNPQPYPCATQAQPYPPGMVYNEPSEAPLMPSNYPYASQHAYPTPVNSGASAPPPPIDNKYPYPPPPPYSAAVEKC